MNLGIYAPYYLCKILIVFGKIQFINFYDEQWAIGILVYEFIVVLIEALQVIQPYVLFIFAAAFLYLIHQLWYGSFQVDKQIRRAYHLPQRIEEGGIIVEVPLRHQVHAVEIGREDVGILINSTILYHGFPTCTDTEQLLQPAIKKIDL